MIFDVLEGRASWAIVQAENLFFLRSLPPGCAHLVYLDPPFFTGRDFYFEDEIAFTDRWESLDDYLAWLQERCRAAWPLLAPEGCLVVHVDPSTSHHVKVMLDAGVGRERFRSEIVWRYRRMPDGSRNFQEMHDVLLRYVRDPGRERWTQLYEPLAPSTLASHGGQRQRTTHVNGKKKALAPSSDASPGAPMSDVWEIGVLAPTAAERLGWPTQKPEELPERLIRACTLPGDLVIDPTAGSATTIAVAERLGRRALGCDRADGAVRIGRARLEAQTTQRRLPGLEGALA